MEIGAGSDVIRADDGNSYLRVWEYAAGDFTTHILSLPLLDTVASLPDRLDYRPVAGGRAWINLNDNIRERVRFDDDFGQRYAFDFTSGGFEVIRPIPQTTLGDNQERFAVTTIDSTGAIPMLHFQIVDSLTTVYYDTLFAYSGSTPAFQPRRFPGSDVIEFIGSEFRFFLRASTLRPVDLGIVQGPFPYENQSVISSNNGDTVNLLDPLSLTVVDQVPYQITFDGTDFLFNRGIALAPGEAFGGAWFDYYGKGVAVVCLADKDGTPIVSLGSPTNAQSTVRRRFRSDGQFYFPMLVENVDGLSRYELYRFDGVSSTQHVQAASVTLSPNPSTGSFHLYGVPGEGSEVSFSIYDFMGRLVYEGSINDPNAAVKLPHHLPTGTYVFNGRVEATGQRFVIQLQVAR